MGHADDCVGTRPRHDPKRNLATARCAVGVSLGATDHEPLEKGVCWEGGHMSDMTDEWALSTVHRGCQTT